MQAGVWPGVCITWTCSAPMREALAVGAAAVVAGELHSAILNRGEEGVYALGAGDLEVDVEVQPGRDLGNVLAVVVIVGDRCPPVAVDREAGQ